MISPFVCMADGGAGNRQCSNINIIKTKDIERCCVVLKGSGFLKLYFIQDSFSGAEHLQCKGIVRLIHYIIHFFNQLNNLDKSST